MANLKRRNFLKFIGASIAAPLLASCNQNQYGSTISLTEELNDPELIRQSIGFAPIQAGTQDELSLPQGFDYKILRSWGDSIGEGIEFGFNNDFTCYSPLKGSKDGLLWVNHEFMDPKYVKGEADQRKAVGGSIIRIKDKSKTGNPDWEFIEDEKYNRRLDANSYFEMTGAAKEKYPHVYGTLANCSGGQTPWSTVLSAEENYHFYDSLYRWKNFNREHYGWIIEVDPYDKSSTPRKHTSLGRFSHENAAITIGKDKRIIVYMGDDKENEHIYKFVSRNKYNPRDEKANRNLLCDGDLYVAKFDANRLSTEAKTRGKGTWELLSLKNPKLKNKFKSQAELLIKTRDAAKHVKATPLDRPEDLEFSPDGKSVFVSLTKNMSQGNFFGSILRFEDDERDPSKFDYEVFVSGGETSEVCCPDNLAFDKKGNLWVTTDIDGSVINKGRYQFHGNNALFMVPMSGDYAGIPQRFAVAPPGAELTGPWFAPDGRTLFLSVQHPGEKNLPSKWPHSPNHDYPRPSVVAITGFDA